MATGDVKNNLRKLIVELKHINYPLTEVNLKALSLGAPTAFLPILHYIFLDFSVELTEFFTKDYELYGKTDLRFVETVYKIMRDVFQFKPPLTREQFLAIGFAERKIIQLCEILKKCREKYIKLKPKGSKMDKKQPIKLKAKLSQNEKKVEGDKGQIKSCLKSNEPRTTIQERFDSKRSNNAGKSILKVKKDENKENRGSNGQSAIEKAEKIQINENAQPFSRLQNGIKNVKWEESERESSVSAPKLAVFSSVNPLSNVIYTTSSSSQPLTTTVAQPLPPRLIPAPVSMTTAPQPSPDLMLTPIAKSKHQAIPLSGSRLGTRDTTADISLVDLTDSTVITQPKIVRHNFADNHAPMPSNLPVMSQDCELKSLKVVVTDLLEKLDTVLAQNNEMSARIVLLENKVNLLEETARKKVCEDCTRKEFLPSSMETTRPMVFRSTNYTQSTESLPIFLETARPLVAVSSAEYIPQIRMQTSRESSPSATTSRRHLLGEFNESQLSSSNGSNKHVYQSHTEAPTNFEEPSTPAIIEISDDEFSIDQSTLATSRLHDTEGLDVISPLQTKDIHLKFSDPTTTATILNVERRLKETRVMLANANAARVGANVVNAV